MTSAPPPAPIAGSGRSFGNPSARELDDYRGVGAADRARVIAANASCIRAPAEGEPLAAVHGIHPDFVARRVVMKRACRFNPAVQRRWCGRFRTRVRK